jgi:hypothetical protein
MTSSYFNGFNDISMDRVSEVLPNMKDYMRIIKRPNYNAPAGMVNNVSCGCNKNPNYTYYDNDSWNVGYHDDKGNNCPYVFQQNIQPGENTLETNCATGYSPKLRCFFD